MKDVSRVSSTRLPGLKQRTIVNRDTVEKKKLVPQSQKRMSHRPARFVSVIGRCQQNDIITHITHMFHFKVLVGFGLFFFCLIKDFSDDCYWA